MNKLGIIAAIDMGIGAAIAAVVIAILVYGLIKLNDKLL